MVPGGSALGGRSVVIYSFSRCERVDERGAERNRHFIIFSTGRSKVGWVNAGTRDTHFRNTEMNTVTIELDDDLFSRARQIADDRKMTVSAMLERLLRVAAAPPLHRNELPPLTRQALGMLPPMTDEQVEQVLDEERMRKYRSP